MRMKGLGTVRQEILTFAFAGKRLDERELQLSSFSGPDGLPGTNIMTSHMISLSNGDLHIERQKKGASGWQQREDVSGLTSLTFEELTQTVLLPTCRKAANRCQALTWLRLVDYKSPLEFEGRPARGRPTRR